ncbi:MAG: hypothetical protein ACE5HE_01630 [Phycisphaerae bacterium]
MSLLLASTVWNNEIASAQGAVRDLSGYSTPGVSFTVSITLAPPAGTIAAALEDTPPAGWPVSSISDGGTWDAVQEKVKWGVFFAPSIPDRVTYDVTPPTTALGPSCFSGSASYDGVQEAITGDACLSIGVPAVSRAGAVVMALLIIAAGVLLCSRRSPAAGVDAG